MASLQQSSITNQGRHLISKGLAGAEIRFTRIGIGSGYLPTGHIPAEQTGLVQPVMYLDIIKLKVLGGGQVVVGSKFSNAGLTNGFYYREVVLFAQDPDAGEIAYSYGNAGTLAEWIPPEGGDTVISKSVDVRTSVEAAQSVTATIRPESDISIEMFEEHTGNSQNPHKVTAAQAGALPAGGTAVNSQKLGGNLPSYFATAAALEALKNGTVNNAEKLGGQVAAYYATASELSSVKTTADNALPKTSTAIAAAKLDTARAVHVDLASSSNAMFDGTEGINPGVYGILPVAGGGTGRDNGSVAQADNAGKWSNLTYNGAASSADSYIYLLSRAANSSTDVRLVHSGAFARASHTHPAGQITSGTFPQSVAALNANLNAAIIRNIAPQNSAGTGIASSYYITRRK